MFSCYVFASQLPAASEDVDVPLELPTHLLQILIGIVLRATVEIENWPFSSVNRFTGWKGRRGSPGDTWQLKLVIPPVLEIPSNLCGPAA